MENELVERKREMGYINNVQSGYEAQYKKKKNLMDFSFNFFAFSLCT